MWFLKLSLYLSLGWICVCITRTDITHYYINPCPKKCRRQSSQKKQIRRLIGLQNGINTSLFPIWREPSPRVTRISPKHLRNSRNHTKLRMHASQNITWFIKHFGYFFNVFRQIRILKQPNYICLPVAFRTEIQVCNKWAQRQSFPM